jgi:hypothetical protein
MTEREKMQFAYELAFYPPRLNELWRQVRNGSDPLPSETLSCLDTACLLHRALPETRMVSQRALTRLALYQAAARAFGTVRFLEAILRRLGRNPPVQTEVPPHLVRDIGLPPFARNHTGPRQPPR